MRKIRPGNKYKVDPYGRIDRNIKREDLLDIMSASASKEGDIRQAAEDLIHAADVGNVDDATTILDNYPAVLNETGGEHENTALIAVVLFPFTFGQFVIRFLP